MIKTPKSLLTLHYHLQFQNAWLIRGAVQERDLDAGFLTDAFGTPYIPGSALKGKMRDAYNRLCSLKPDWKQYQAFLFGEPGLQGGQVYFYDGYPAVHLEQAQYAEQRTRIAIDRFRKVVHDTALLTERVVRAGVPFAGSIATYVSDEEKLAIGIILASCMLSIASIGSGHSVGRGAISMKYGLPTNHEKSADSFCWLTERHEDGTEHIWTGEYLQASIENMGKGVAR